MAASNASKNVMIIGLDDQRLFLPLWAHEVIIITKIITTTKLVNIIVKKGSLQIYSDPVASKYFAGMGLHWYFDAVAPALSMSAVHASYPDKFILYTEVQTTTAFSIRYQSFVSQEHQHKIDHLFEKKR